MKPPVEILIEKFVDKLKRSWGDNLVSIVLYGSVAREDYRPDSDIDLLIIGEHLPVNQLERRSEMTQLTSQLDKDIAAFWDKGYYHYFSTIMKTREEARHVVPIYLDMVEDAIILYDKDGFFQSILSQLKEKLERLGAKRVYIGKNWYWDLAPNAKFGETVIL
jgi:predicted nucleotidyltransferase